MKFAEELNLERNMKAFLKTSYTFLTAFVITGIVIAAIAAAATLGDDDKVLYFEEETRTMFFFGNEYVVSPRFITAVQGLFDCNKVFLGEHGLSLAKKAVSFPIEYVGSLFSLIFGVFEGIIKNSV